MISNKLMGLATLALLAGGIGFTAVGCSSSETDPTEEETDGGAKTDSGVKPKPDAAPGECEPVGVDASYYDEAPRSSTGKQNSCTGAEITTIEANFKKTGITEYPQLAEGVSDTCKSCFMLGIDGTDVPSTNVPLYVYVNAEPGRGFLNEGFCAAQLSNPDCGANFSSFDSCYVDVCGPNGGKCGDLDDQGQPDEDLAACMELVDDEHPCVTIGQEKISASCKDQATLTKIQAGCYTAPNNAFSHWIEVACGPATATPDGGTTTPDAGDGG